MSHPPLPEAASLVGAGRGARPRYAGAALAALAVLGAGLLTGGQGPRLTSGYGGALGFTDGTASHPYTVEGIPLCLDRAGAVTVVGVSPTDTHSAFRVRAFAVRPFRYAWYLGQRGTPAVAGFHPGGPRRVTAACGHGQDELGVQVERTTAGPTAQLNGITVEYLSAGLRQSVRVPVILTLCAPGDRTDPFCGG